MERIERWFHTRGWESFAFQRETWSAYLAGRSGLVHAPTGMGKTYAVWLGPILEYLQESAVPHPTTSGPAPEKKAVGRRSPRDRAEPLRVLWITPLRALANDTVQTLQAPVRDLNLPWTVELRTGDTSSAQRRRQRDRLPTALVTTPESLSLLLSYPDARERLRSLRCVVVDEWHELLGTKRGVQTELGLARLRAWNPALRTWGLSATLGNIDEALTALVGGQPFAENAPGSAVPTEGMGTPVPSAQRTLQDTASAVSLWCGEPRPGVLVRGHFDKQVEIVTLCPPDVERFPWAGHLGTKLLPGVIAAIESARSTLMFTNTRSQAELWFQAMLRSRPDLIGAVALHHGSLDRGLRTKVEAMLAGGALRCVVCTSSLDLGVDFSPVDQVIQLGSPKGIARLMQRAGRSGHQPGATSRILCVPTHAFELVEFAAARDAMLARRIESRLLFDRPLDVLVQHLVTVALGGGFEEAAMYEEVRQAYAFAKLSREEWGWCLDFVTRGGPALHAYPDYQKVVVRDGRYVVESRRIARFHRLSIGTISSDTSMTVKTMRGSRLGTIEESFIARLAPGERFVFAGHVLELVLIREMTAYVRKVKQASGVVPKWMGGRMPLSSELSAAVRKKLVEDPVQASVGASPAEASCEEGCEMRAVSPLLDLQREWSRLPGPGELLIEHTHSRQGYHVFVFPFDGRLVHEGLAPLAAYRLSRREPISVNVTATDYGFELLSKKPLPVDEATWRELLSTDGLLDDLLACLNSTQLARRQFRDIARVAGLVFQGYPGSNKTTRQLQASSELFFDVFSEYDPQNLLLDQARREVLEQQLEVRRLRATLERVANLQLTIVRVDQFTPLAFPIYAESLRSQHVTSEGWADRVQRMVVRLEKAADPKAREGPRRGAIRVGR